MPPLQAQTHVSVAGWFFICLLYVSGTAGALLYKAMTLYNAAPGPGQQPTLFNHPYLTTLFMYFGEFLDVTIIIATEFYNKKKKVRTIEEEQALVMNVQDSNQFSFPIILTFFGVTVVDVIGSTLYNVAVEYALISICQMVRNCSCLFVAAFSAICFKSYRQKFDLPQVVGLVILTLGMLLICIISYYFDNTQKYAPNNFLGIILIIISQAFSSMVFVMEEFIFRRISLTGMQAVSSEGWWGTLIYVFVIFTLNWTYVPSAQSGQTLYQPVESFQVFDYQMYTHPLLIAYMVLYVFSIIFYSYSSLEITNHVNAVARSMFDSTKTLLVWGLSIAFGWEQLDPVGTPCTFVGYCMVVVGTLIYNRVVKWVPNVRRGREGQE